MISISSILFNYSIWISLVEVIFVRPKFPSIRLWDIDARLNPNRGRATVYIETGYCLLHDGHCIFEIWTSSLIYLEYYHQSKLAAMRQCARSILGTHMFQGCVSCTPKAVIRHFHSHPNHLQLTT